MTTAIVVLASALLIALGCIAALSLWARGLVADRTAANERGETYKDERDAATVRLAATQAQLESTARLLEATANQRDAAQAAQTEHAVEEIRNAATDGDALAALNAIVRAPILPEAAGPRASGDDLEKP